MTTNCQTSNAEGKGTFFLLCCQPTNPNQLSLSLYNSSTTPQPNNWSYSLSFLATSKPGIIVTMQPQLQRCFLPALALLAVIGMAHGHTLLRAAPTRLPAGRTCQPPALQCTGEPATAFNASTLCCEPPFTRCEWLNDGAPMCREVNTFVGDGASDADSRSTSSGDGGGAPPESASLVQACPPGVMACSGSPGSGFQGSIVCCPGQYARCTWLNDGAPMCHQWQPGVVDRA